jgi:hypothetical protein
MNSVVLLSLLLLGGLQLVVSWDVDSRCRHPFNRMLEIEEEDSLVDEGFGVNEVEVINTTTTSALRGSTSTSIVSTSTSRELQDISVVFALKMYWESGFCWQEEYDRHRKWCWECKSSCKEDHKLWWQKCSGSQDQQFIHLPDQEGGRFKTANHDLCLQRVSDTQYRLKGCSSNPNQLIVGFRSDGEPFELLPLGETAWCINQDHHPKAKENVENTKCTTARRWKTNLMELYDIGSDNNVKDVFDDDDAGKLRLRHPECSKRNPCGLCQGDCDEDSHCEGDGLVCFKRGDKTKDDPVPRCPGNPVTGKQMISCSCFYTMNTVAHSASPTSRP